MVILSIVAAGVGLAIDAYSERKARREEDRRRSEGQIDGEIDTSIEHTDRNQQEQDAFNELQQYADFQSNLSTKVLDDLSQGDISMANSEPAWPTADTLNHEPRGLLSSYGAHHGTLEWPIIVPQNHNLNGDTYWKRAYPQPLLESGIDHSTFLNFLDSFDVHIRLSARFEAVNIASIASRAEMHNSPERFYRTVPMAVQVMKAYQKDQKSNSFLNHANALVFQPRGLFAMVMTYRYDSPLQVINVEATPHLPVSQVKGKMKMCSDDDLSMPLEAVSMVQPIESGPATQPIHQTEESMDFDFLQRKRYFEKIHKMHSPRTKLFQAPTEPGSSSPASPSRSPLSNILSSVGKHRERRVDSVARRIRRDKRPFPRSNVPLSPGMISASSGISKGRTQSGQPREDEFGTENGALYLVIVNDTQNPPAQSRDMGLDVYSSKVTSHVDTSGSTYEPIFNDPTTAPPAYSERRYVRGQF